MTGQPRDDAAASVALRPYLAARMRPLALLLFVLVSAAAPLAAYVQSLRTLRYEAAATAGEVAAILDREVQERPTLWRYDSLKLLTHLRAITARPNIARVELIDRAGERVDLREDDEAHAPVDELLWAASPLVINGELVGHVWAAARPDAAARTALLVLAPFSLLGLALSLLVYFLPLRAMGQAERRIDGLIARLRESQAELERFNQRLEQQVAARSVELTRANDALVRKEERLREVSSRAIALQESERRVIARELHDSAGQALTAIRINLQLIAGAAGNAAMIERLATRTLEVADATVEEIRRAVVLLGPAILDDFGLAVAVRRYCDDFVERTGLELHAEIDLPEAGLAPALESACYRILQEGLTNVSRHARAAEVSVRLTCTEGHVTLEIADDGAGFDPDAIGPRPVGAGGRGLVGIRERVDLLGGELTIDSRPGEGARLTVTLPRRERDASS
ncbi:MAG: sensor histidine kinase [Nannocystaceae bacterium]